eukprot:scaffold21150_cov129-Isochrysis_galbana.AAC.2
MARGICLFAGQADRDPPPARPPPALLPTALSLNPPLPCRRRHRAYTRWRRTFGSRTPKPRRGGERRTAPASTLSSPGPSSAMPREVYPLRHTYRLYTFSRYV